MKIPIQTPLEQLRDAINTMQHQLQQGIAAFRKNILTNRDAQHAPKHPRSKTDSHAVSTVSYEAAPKAVDAESFAYALTAEMTENQADNLTQPTRQHWYRVLWQHPARVIAVLVIMVLLVYTVIMFAQAKSNHTTQITSPNTQQRSN
ncbi:hypothetical protein [Leuconostoc lactis]|uniref:hypothetical protein n=1 Tax=Leuconostoc lactis TaxID=1246 RepID=UPI001678805B|nr:hypothetical protein [Leuconostoc lactis]GHC24158.1 hypothetical protein GCM10008913_10100 [Leuconostoc lactis KCTC 3528 = DSM 20202]